MHENVVKSYKISVVSCVLYDETQGTVLIQKRTAICHHKDQYRWTFPGGKIEINETVEEAFRRELFEETNLSVEKDTPLLQIGHCSTLDFVVLFLLCLKWEGTLINKEPNKCSDYKWVKPITELYQYPLTEGMEIFNGSWIFNRFISMCKNKIVI